jgi:FOG: WD40-like repeat
LKWLSNTKEITSFILKKADNPILSNDLIGTVSADSILINLPTGITTNSLIPTITHNGMSISPLNHVANDFTIPPTYTVTAEDGTTHDYKVYMSANRSIYVNGDDGFLYSINAVNGSVQWKFNSGTVSAVPTYYNGTVFVAGANNVVYAVDATNGTLKWSSTPPKGNYSLTIPAVSGGKVYFAGAGYLNYPNSIYAHYVGFVFALNAETGNQEWLSNLTLDSNYMYSDSRITNVTVKDNIVALYDIMNGLFVYNATDGSSLWTDVGDMLGRENPVLSNNTVYFGIEGGMRAMQADNGTSLWRLFGTANNIVVFYSPTIFNNLMYTVDTKANLYSIDLNGNIKWAINLGVNSPSYSSPFVSNNLIYLFSSSNELSAYTTDNGTFKWKRPGFYGQPVVANNDIYITDVNKQLNCLDATTGNIKWTSPLQHFSQPFCVVDANGVAYHITYSGEQQ